jgi:multiple sugar transport system substrate-binding protein
MNKWRVESVEWRAKGALLGALAILLLVFVAGCGRDRNLTTIRFASWGNDVEEANLRLLIAEFEKRHPNIKVEIEITPWARMFDKLMISSAGGRPPDVTRISSEWFPPIAAKGLLEPLEPYVKRDNYDLDDFYPEAIEAWGKYNGVLYEIPTDIDIYAMYYNKTMFDKYKLPYPDWDWDWKKYVEVAKKLTKDLDGDGKLDQWGCAPDIWWEDYVHSNGGTILSADNKTCTLNEPAAYEGLQFMADLVHKYKVAPTPEDAQSLGMSKLFTSGKIAMNVSGSWAAELIYKNEIKDFVYDVGPLPKGPKGRSSFFGGAAYAILSRSKHKDEAWELVKWMTGKEYQTSAAIRSQIIPSRRSVAESAAYLKLKAPPKNRKVFLDMIPYGRRIPGVACSPEMYSIIVSELDKVRLGKISAKEACESIKPTVDELLRHSD